MKSYKILKTFHGNQTGFGETVAFVEGETAQLSDSLAEVALKEGWVQPAEIKPRKLADGEMLEEADMPADARATKVVEPEETKPAAPAAKKGKK